MVCPLSTSTWVVTAKISHQTVSTSSSLEINADVVLVGELRVMACMWRLCLEGVSFSGLRCIKEYRDFTSEGVWKSREICHCVILKGLKFKYSKQMRLMAVGSSD